jgi:ketosteroid isomerase-like protein
MKSIRHALHATSALCLFALSTLSFAQQAQSVRPGKPEPPEVKEFQQLEDNWSDALVKNDQYALENLLSPVYVDIAANGDVTTRNQQIALLFQKSAEPISMEQRVASVRTFGDTAIVSGTYIARHKLNGDTREDRGIFTHVYARARGKWLCVNAQRTTVIEQSTAKPKAEAKKSDSALPFHIPLFHKGDEPAQPPSASSPAPPN